MSGKDTGITSLFFGGRQLQRALRRYDLDVSNEESTRQQMERFARRRLQRYLQQQQQQQGGHVVLPSEYFGADSGRYSPVAAGTDMSATAVVARPELPLNLVGGAACPRYITQSAVREECARMGQRRSGNCQSGGSVKLGGTAFREITDRLNRDIDSVFSRVRQQFGRNQRHLSQARLQQTLRDDFE